MSSSHPYILDNLVSGVVYVLLLREFTTYKKHFAFMIFRQIADSGQSQPVGQS